MITKAIIGGTGVYEGGSNFEEVKVSTEYGEVAVTIGDFSGEKIAFLARHGSGHNVPPHKINYLANMKALSELGVNFVFTTAAVGSCSADFQVGDLVMIDDFFDFTSGRVSSYYEDGVKVAHVKMDAPYCPNLQRKFLGNADGLQIKGNAVYGCTQGPRFETAAEIRAYSRLGATVIGMTSVPEVCLAKELGMCYATIGVVTNMCTGFSSEISEHDITASMQKNKAKLIEVFLKVFSSNLTQDECSCKDALLFL